MLDLRACCFDPAPFTGEFQRLERSGVVAWRDYRMQADGFELPDAGVELLVMGRGRLLGRFVLDPTPGTGVSLEQRVVAVALADQVGAVLAAPTAERTTGRDPSVGFGGGFVARADVLVEPAVHRLGAAPDVDDAIERGLRRQPLGRRVRRPACNPLRRRSSMRGWSFG